jgi:hypothetical protein
MRLLLRPCFRSQRRTMPRLSRKWQCRRGPRASPRQVS